MCLKEFAKAVLIIVNIIFFLAGAALLAVGIWARVDNTSLTDFVSNIPFDDGALNSVSLLEAASYLLIALGAFILVIGFIGCCGAMRSSRVLLGIYIALLVVIIIIEISIGVLAVIYRGKIESVVDERLKKELNEKYVYGSLITDEGKVEARVNDSVVAQGWDFVQFRLKCCGVDGYADYQNNDIFGSWRKEVSLEGTLETNVDVPLSCCRRADGVDFPEKKDDFEDIDKCLAGDADFINRVECSTEIKEFLEEYSIIIIGVGFGILALELIVLIAAIYLCVLAGKDR